MCGRCIALYPEPWWRKDPLANMSFAFMPDWEGAAQIAYDISPLPPRGKVSSVGILATFITIDTPKYFDFSEDELREAVLEGFSKVMLSKGRVDPTSL